MRAHGFNSDSQDARECLVETLRTDSEIGERYTKRSMSKSESSILDPITSLLLKSCYLVPEGHGALRGERSFSSLLKEASTLPICIVKSEKSECMERPCYHRGAPQPLILSLKCANSAVSCPHCAVKAFALEDWRSFGRGSIFRRGSDKCRSSLTLDPVTPHAPFFLALETARWFSHLDEKQMPTTTW
jgi:hypothetical protein